MLEVDPDLGGGLDGADLVAATRQAVGTLEDVEPGSWRPLGVHDGKLLFGGLIFEGLIVRELALGSSFSAELLGAGDIVVPYDADQTVPFVPSASGWSVVEPARIVWLDAPFAVAVRRWPQLGIALLQRAQRRADRLAVTQAIAQITRVDDRILALLWHLSERWGRVTSDGVVLPIRLTHRAIARLVGAQRPSVTTALSTLDKRGLLARRDDGAWVLGAPLEPVDDGPHEPLTWKQGNSASLVPPPPPPPPPPPIEVRLATLSATSQTMGWASASVIAQARRVRDVSIVLRDQARRVRGLD